MEFINADGSTTKATAEDILRMGGIEPQTTEAQIYSIAEARAVVSDQIDGEDPNSDAYAGLMCPVRGLLDKLEGMAKSAAELVADAEAGNGEPLDAYDALRELAALTQPEKTTVEDKPQEGRLYRLTGGPGTRCIAQGDSWADSEIEDPDGKEN